jgi:hypothetical protein
MRRAATVGGFDARSLRDPDRGASTACEFQPQFAATADHPIADDQFRWLPAVGVHVRDMAACA